MRDSATAQPLQAAEPVTASVKWYSNGKGVGFVAPKDGSAEALLHRAALVSAGTLRLNKNDILTCEIGETARGRQVIRVLSIQPGAPSTVEPLFRSTGRPTASPRPLRSLQSGASSATVTTAGTVKFYDAWRGFGFVVPDNGAQDIYVTARTLEQTGLSALQQHQRVRVTTRLGPKGPIAISVEAA